MSDLLSLAERVGPFDKTGRQIEIGDILKVYHFTGARRYFMYKQVVGETTLGKSGNRYLQVSHLNMKPFDDRDGGYHLACDYTIHDHIEIVQGIDWHHDRVRAKARAADGREGDA